MWTFALVLQRNLALEIVPSARWWGKAGKKLTIGHTIALFGRTVMASYGNEWTHHTAPKRPAPPPIPRDSEARLHSTRIGNFVWVSSSGGNPRFRGRAPRSQLTGSIWDGQFLNAPAPSRAAPRHPVEHEICRIQVREHKKTFCMEESSSFMFFWWGR